MHYKTANTFLQSFYAAALQTTTTIYIYIYTYIIFFVYTHTPSSLTLCILQEYLCVTIHIYIYTPTHTIFFNPLHITGAPMRNLTYIFRLHLTGKVQLHYIQWCFQSHTTHSFTNAYYPATSFDRKYWSSSGHCIWTRKRAET